MVFVLQRDNGATAAAQRLGRAGRRLPLGSAHRHLVNPMSGNTDLPLSIPGRPGTTVTFPGWLGQLIRFVVLLGFALSPWQAGAWRQTVPGEFAIKARTSRHTLVSGRLCYELNHDAVIRIGGEAKSAAHQAMFNIRLPPPRIVIYS